MKRQLNYTELDDFCKKIRRISFEATLKTNKKKKYKEVSDDDLETIITIKEIRTLLLSEYSLKKTKDYVILDNDYKVCQQMLSSVTSRLINNELNKMVNDNILECYFDDKTMDFMFKTVD